MQNELIVVSDYCNKCHIEPSFIDLLEENGLIDILFDEGRPCLTFSQLPDVERIHHLLERMEDMQREIRDLRTRLRMFE